MTVNLPPELQDRARDAYWLVRGDYRTFADWVAEALSAQIERTKQQAGVDTVPPRPSGGLPAGRPLG